MGTERTHRAVSSDGTEIVASVHGQGPPLVMVAGILEDSEMTWEGMLPLLTERFTCLLTDTRGRGRSGDHPDHSPRRLWDDIASLADSVGEPVGLVGESGGAGRVLGAAARASSVAAVAVYEPAVASMLTDEDVARFEQGVMRMSALADEGDTAEAARTLLSVVAREEELAALPDDYFQTAGGYVSVFLQELSQSVDHEGPDPFDPTSLGRITAPVLLLHGAETAMPESFSAAVQHVAQHVAEPRVVELPGVGHLAPAVAPEVVAPQLTGFFDGTLTPT